MKLRIARAVAGFLLLALSLVPLTVAQTPAETGSALPRLVRFGGTVKDLNGGPLTGVVGITFALYSEQTAGAALWLETQNVTADSNGHYVALLGSTKPVTFQLQDNFAWQHGRHAIKMKSLLFSRECGFNLEGLGRRALFAFLPWPSLPAFSPLTDQPFPLLSDEAFRAGNTQGSDKLEKDRYNLPFVCLSPQKIGRGRTSTGC